MKEVETPQSSVFMGHGYVQHRGSECRGSHCIRYHTYLIPENYDLPDSIAFEYGDSTHVGSRENALSVEKVDGSGEAEVDVLNSEKESFEENDKMNPELSDLNLEQGSILEEK